MNFSLFLLDHTLQMQTGEMNWNNRDTRLDILFRRVHSRYKDLGS